MRGVRPAFCLAQEMARGLGRGQDLLGSLQRRSEAPATFRRRENVAMKSLRLILGDQLARSISALGDIDPGNDTVLMVEVKEEASYVRHHQQKIAFIFSAMRHFAAELRAQGIAVDYVTLDDPDNSGSLTGEVQRAIRRLHCDKVVVTEPGEWRVLAAMRRWPQSLGLPVDLRGDSRFFADHARFKRWAEGRSSFRMEFFYREMRRDSGLLMEGDAPAGGQWNFDVDNRKPIPRGTQPPARQRFAPDEVTTDVLRLVEANFSDHFGDLRPFEWAVTRHDALQALAHFLAVALPNFGTYQDAMRSGEAFLYHSLLSPYLNIGLLTPQEVCQRAETEYRQGRAPLNAVEGFIRQILGWREYIRGMYWHHMPDYAATNALNATRPLPSLYWSGQTDMNCLSEAVGQTRRHAYSHHIQRLMVTGNFALLAGVRPAEIAEWYLAVYIDAYEWVELPNTQGMSMFADGGLIASKPYASSGAYIDRMSDFCKGCRYDVKQKTGAKACPFNYLYWAFLIRNRDVLRSNPRMAMPYRTLARWDDARKAEMVDEAERFLDGLA
jgi:deoxyribodipyrimidine photolyase-related protein